jgi:(R,R)-butanediol dehydrogenase/meso-butanediol dehydrogenase/diacetyl reductase
MKAAVFHGRRDVRLDEVPEPVVRPGHVKVRVDWCGICGSDMHQYLAGPINMPLPGKPHPLTGETIPVTMGHEFAGEIVDVGEGVSGVGIGDRAAIEPIYRCGKCPQCRRGAYNLCEKLGFQGLSGGGGGFAEYTVVPEYMVHRLPEAVSTEEGALVEPVAVGLRALRQASFREGQSAVVLGGGPIGAVTVQCLRARGASLIAVAEVSEARQRKAREVGADVVIDPRNEDVVARVKELTAGQGADVSFDAAGIQQTFQTALRATAKGGTVVNIAIWEGPIEIHPNDIVMNELKVVGTHAYASGDFPDTIALMQDARIDAGRLVTERIPLSDVIERGLEELATHKDRHVKILVRPSA